jgi:hypothetical protein
MILMTILLVAAEDENPVTWSSDSRQKSNRYSPFEESRSRKIGKRRREQENAFFLVR